MRNVLIGRIAPKMWIAGVVIRVIRFSSCSCAVVALATKKCVFRCVRRFSGYYPHTFFGLFEYQASIEVVTVQHIRKVKWGKKKAAHTAADDVTDALTICRHHSCGWSECGCKKCIKQSTHTRDCAKVCHLIGMSRSNSNNNNNNGSRCLVRFFGGRVRLDWE